MLKLQLLGGCALLSHGEPLAGPVVQRRRLALLALLASSPTGGMSRDKLVAYFWPDDERDRARHFLSASLFTIRKALGKEAVLTVGDDVRINADAIHADAARFEALATRGDFAEAVALYRGPFLDGFCIADASEFERWSEIERDRLARRYAWCLERLAERREAEGDWAAGAEWWRLLAVHDPYSSRVALRAMRALDTAGDPASALRQADKHEARVRDDLGLAPDAEIAAVAGRLRNRPPSTSRSGSSGVVPHRPERLPVAPAPEAASDRVPGGVGPGDEGGLDLERPPARTSADRHESRGRPIYRRPPVLVAASAVVLVSASLLSVRIERPLPPGAGPTPMRAAVSDAGSVRESDVVSPTRRDEARVLYDQGRYYAGKETTPAIRQRALELFRRAAERDPTYVPAYAGMADLYNQGDDFVRAKDAALTALSLDSSFAEAHTSLAYVLAFYEHRWAAADSALSRAVALSPRYVLAHVRRAYVLAALGRGDDAMAEVERARALEPESWNVLVNRGLIANAVGRDDEGIAHLEAALVLEPARRDVREMLAWAYWTRGRFAEAEAMMRTAGDVAAAAALSGDRQEMARLARSYAAAHEPGATVKAAKLYAQLGRANEAFALLDDAYARHDKFLALALRQAPLLSLRTDSRYTRLLAKLGLSNLSA